MRTDPIVAMRAGRVIADGAPDRIMTGETLREVFDTEVAVHQVEGRHVGVYYG